MTTILLTGGRGFIGTWLFPKLVEKGYNVVSMVKPSKDLNKQPWEVFCDLRDSDRVLSVIATAQPDIILHLAGATAQRESFVSPDLFYDTNFLGGRTLIRAALKVLGAKFRLVYASTCEVYGDNGHAVKREDQELRPQSPYADSKRIFDNFIDVLDGYNGLDFARLRANNTYGRPFSGFFIESRMEELLRGEVPKLYTPYHSRDYGWVEDHVGGYLTILEKGQGTYNLAGGEPITNYAMVRLMSKIVLGKDVTPTVVNSPSTRPVDHRSLILDTSLIRQLGWKPLNTREEGIKKLADMYAKPQDVKQQAVMQ